MFKEERNSSSFRWEQLGDMDLGRPNLGAVTSVAVYRLMQYTLRDAAIMHVGVEKADRIFYDAGCSAGMAFYENLIGNPESFDDLVSKLQQTLKELNIGILRFEESNIEGMQFTLTVDEDLDCSGLPDTDETVCTYDEGFIAGIFERFTGQKFEVKEVDCWSSGARTCRFQAHIA